MLIPAFLFLFTFFFYLLTHCASFNIADSGETILACSQLDIGHSPSYPLHALWGRVNCLLPLGQPMLRVTFSSIITGAGSTVILYLVLKIIFKEIFYANKTTQPVPVEKKPPRWILEIPALFGALTFGFSSEQWFQACGAKGGIYTLNTLFSLCVFLILFKMREKGCFIKSFFLTTYIFCLSLANHWENQVVMAPAYLWFFFSSQRRIPFENILKSILRPFDFFTNIANIASALGIHNIIRGITFGLLSLSVYLYLPLRASRNPAENFWDPQTALRFWQSVTRKSFNGYGDPWGWTTISRNLARFWVPAHDQYGSLFSYLIFALMASGFLWFWSKKQKATAMGFLLFGNCVFWGVILVITEAKGLEWLLDYFFTPVFMVVSILASAGIARWCFWISEKWPSRSLALLAGFLCLGFALMPLFLNYKSNDQSRYVVAYDEGVNMLKTVKDDSVILCNGDIDLLPLWYLQLAQGKRPKVIPLSLQMISYAWYRNSLFKHWPVLETPVGQNDRDQTIVQNMINIHTNELSFYYTNTSTPKWLSDNNPTVPDGMLWRLAKTKNLDYPVTGDRLNQLWGSYRLRFTDPSQWGYWDEFSDFIRVYVYDYAQEYMGLFAFKNQMPDIALWSFKNALKDSPPANQAGIYQMEGEIYLLLDNPMEAVNNYEDSLKYNPQNPYVYAKIGQANLRMKNNSEAETAFQTSLSLNPNQKEASDGLQQIKNLRTK